MSHLPVFSTLLVVSLAQAQILVVDLDTTTQGPGYKAPLAAQVTLPLTPSANLETRREVVSGTRVTVAVYFIFDEGNPPRFNHVGADLHWSTIGDDAQIIPVPNSTFALGFSANADDRGNGNPNFGTTTDRSDNTTVAPDETLGLLNSPTATDFSQNLGGAAYYDNPAGGYGDGPLFFLPHRFDSYGDPTVSGGGLRNRETLDLFRTDLIITGKVGAVITVRPSGIFNGAASVNYSAVGSVLFDQETGASRYATNIVDSIFTIVPADSSPFVRITYLPTGPRIVFRGLMETSNDLVDWQTVMPQPLSPYHLSNLENTMFFRVSN